MIRIDGPHFDHANRAEKKGKARQLLSTFARSWDAGGKAAAEAKLQPMNTALSISIGVLAAQAGCTVPTIRYYEQIGLLPAGPRTESGRRAYDRDAVRRLSFIRRCRDFGFSIEQVRELIALVDEPGRPCVEVRDVAARHLADVREKIAELRALEQSMSAFVCDCEAACAGGASVDCSIIEVLGSTSGPSTPTKLPSSLTTETACCPR